MAVATHLRGRKLPVAVDVVQLEQINFDGVLANFRRVRVDSYRVRTRPKLLFFELGLVLTQLLATVIRGRKLLPPSDLANSALRDLEHPQAEPLQRQAIGKF